MEETTRRNGERLKEIRVNAGLAFSLWPELHKIKGSKTDTLLTFLAVGLAHNISWLATFCCCILMFNCVSKVVVGNMTTQAILTEFWLMNVIVRG